jgi:hypothetical protein
MKLDTKPNNMLDQMIKTYSRLHQEVYERDEPELANPNLALDVSDNVIPLPVGLERLPPLHWQDVEARLATTLSRISSDMVEGVVPAMCQWMNLRITTWELSGA